MNKRRKLIVALGAGAITTPFGSLAQPQGKVWKIGVLVTRQVVLSDSDYFYGPFREGMRELGYVEGRNLVIEWRSADGNLERLPRLAAELVQLKVDVIVAAGTPATGTAQKATSAIPIIMVSVGNPVGSGFIESLARPGGNITGNSIMTVDIMPKRLELLLDMVPKASRVAVLINPANSSNRNGLEAVEIFAKKRGIFILRVEAGNSNEIDKAFAVMQKQKVDVLMVALDSIFQQQKKQIAELAAKNRLPAMAAYREFAEAGGLISYGSSLADQARRAAIYVDKVLKGAKAGDIPVEQPTKFELTINRKTAKTLGLTIPQSLLISADTVIE